MKRRLRYRGEDRDKAWLGALIGAVGSIAGSIINGNKQREEAKRQAREAELARIREQDASLTNALAMTANAQNAYEEQYRTPYACGGRKKARLGVKITDGGYALPIGRDTYLLRGATHNQFNESGKTGIGLKIYSRGGSAKKNQVIEAENNEVIQKIPNGVRIFSDTLTLPNGMTIAEAAKAGYDKNKLFAYQQASNGDYGSRPVGNRRRAAFGALFTGSDAAGFGINTAGSILSNIYNRRLYNSLKKYAPQRPVLYQAGKLNTNVNINPQLSNLENTLGQGLRTIDRDMASSIGSIDRKNALRLQTRLAENDLYGTKYAKEAELINEDIKNQQSINNKNIEAYNAWRNAQNQYLAGLDLNKGKSNIDMIQGLVNAGIGTLQTATDRYADRETMRNYALMQPLDVVKRLHAGNRRLFNDYIWDKILGLEVNSDNYSDENNKSRAFRKRNGLDY